MLALTPKPKQFYSFYKMQYSCRVSEWELCFFRNHNNDVNVNKRQNGWTFVVSSSIQNPYANWVDIVVLELLKLRQLLIVISHSPDSVNKSKFSRKGLFFTLSLHFQLTSHILEFWEIMWEDNWNAKVYTGTLVAAPKCREKDVRLFRNSKLNNSQ